MTLPPLVSRLVLAGLALAAVALAWWSRPPPERAEEPSPPASRPRPAPSAPALVLAVDASDLPRGLVQATVSWPTRPGRLWLRFPRWIQGTHAPCGAVENLAGLRIRDDRGNELPWQRDPLDVYRFAVDLPAGSTSVAIALTYLANQSTINSQPIDVLVHQGVALFNWNDALLYPEGWADTALRVSASLRLPAGWRQACALEATAAADGVLAFAVTDLRTLIDSPVLCGRELFVHELLVEGFAPHRLAVAAPQSLAAPPERALAQLRAVAAEARELWGSAPSARYTWLLALGEETPRFGLEHLASSANGLPQESWFDDDGVEAGAAFLLSHEYGHMWIGKHHRPAGMLTADCHTPLDTRLLWVYEGFDQYLGMLLAARSGAAGRTAWMEHLAFYVDRVLAGRSRTWRSLEDTAAASHLLRGPSRNWASLRGAQDYYLEGMLLCFEADGLIRRASGGTRCFDDVLRRLFATGAVGTVLPFSEADVLAALRSVEPSVDWPALIARWVRRTGGQTATAAEASLAAWGMRAVWDEARPDNVRTGYLDERWSVGVVLWRGRITEVVPGSPADAARLAPGSLITGIGEAPFSQTAWDAALRETPIGGTIRLRLREADGSERAAVLACPRRPRYLRVEPSAEPADNAILEAILAPRSAEGRAVRAGGGGW